MPLPANYASQGAMTTKRGRKKMLSRVMHDSWVDAAAIDDNGFLTTTAGPNATTITPTLNGALTSGGVGTNDFARSVIVTVTHGSSIVACNGIISGTDIGATRSLQHGQSQRLGRLRRLRRQRRS